MAVNKKIKLKGLNGMKLFKSYLVKLALTLFALSGISSISLAQEGFDERYEAWKLTNGDIYVKQNPEIVLLHGDIITPIVLPAPVEEFVLLPQGQGYSTSSDTSTVNLSGAVQVDVSLGDFNVDGLLDIVLKDIGANVFDQIVFADAAGVPQVVTTADEEFVRFFDDVYRWILNSNYFEENKGYRVVGTEPNSRTWSGFFNNGASPLLIGVLLNTCEIQNPGSTCGISSSLPSDCSRSVVIRNDFGVIIGQGTVDVCEYSNQIYAYQPGSVTLEEDFSAFSQDALVFADEAVDLDTFNLDGILDIWRVLSQDSDSIDIIDILEDVLGIEVLGGIIRNGGILASEGNVDSGNLDEVRGMSIQVGIETVARETQRPTCRKLTVEEKALASSNGISIDRIDNVDICFSRTRLMGAADLMRVSPVGHIYVNPNLITWSSNYAVSPWSIQVRALLVHELVHVALHTIFSPSVNSPSDFYDQIFEANGDYIYSNHFPDADYNEFNVEEQAEIVKDRYLRRSSTTQGIRSPNLTVTLTEMEEVIPF